MQISAYKSLQRMALSLATAMILMQTTCIMPTFPTVIPNDWFGGTAVIMPSNWYVPDYSNISYDNPSFYNPGYYGY